MLTKAVMRTGKHQRIGTSVSANDKMGVFAGYTKCEQCQCDLKIILRIAEARELAQHLGLSKAPKVKWKVKLAKKIAKWAESVTMSEATRGERDDLEAHT